MKSKQLHQTFYGCVALILAQCAILYWGGLNLSSQIYWRGFALFQNIKDGVARIRTVVAKDNQLYTHVLKLNEEKHFLNAQIQVLEDKLLMSSQLDHIALYGTKPSHWTLAKVRDCAADHFLVENKYGGHLKQGSLVLGQQGVMGTLASDCDDLFCQVNRLNHPDAKLAVISHHGGSSGLLTSNQSNQLELKYLDQGKLLAKNDVLYTHGLINEQPAGFPVATIKSRFADINGVLRFNIKAFNQSKCGDWAMVWHKYD
jgi:hypothetical protein